MNARHLLLATAITFGAAALLLALNATRHHLHNRRAAQAGAQQPPTRRELALRMYSAETMPDAVTRFNPAVLEAERILSAVVDQLPVHERRRLDQPG